MAEGTYAMKSKVVVYPGMAVWRFLALPQKEGVDIKKKYGKFARGWGSLPVSATIGKITWKSSIFPDKKSGTYVLPLKLKVRTAEGILDEDTVRFRIKILI